MHKPCVSSAFVFICLCVCVCVLHSTCVFSSLSRTTRSAPWGSPPPTCRPRTDSPCGFWEMYSSCSTTPSTTAQATKWALPPQPKPDQHDHDRKPTQTPTVLKSLPPQTSHRIYSISDHSRTSITNGNYSETLITTTLVILEHILPMATTLLIIIHILPMATTVGQFGFGPVWLKQASTSLG